MMRHGVSLPALLAPALLALVGCAQPDRPPHVTGPWIREAPPGMAMSAGYLVLHNPSSRELVLTGASSPDFGEVEFHNTVTENNVSRMRQERQVPVPAGGSVDFVPGGRHLMLMQPSRNLRVGDQVTIRLVFADGSELHFTATVQRQAG